MPLHGRGRAGQTRYLHHRPLPVQAVGDVVADGIADAVIVGTDIGGIFVGKNLAVHHNDGDAAVVGFFHDGSDGFRLVGRDDQQVHPFVQEAAYVAHLLLTVVLGRADNDLQVAVELRLAPHLGVLLMAPLVVAALGHADDVARLFGVARQEEETAYKGYIKNQILHGIYIYRIIACKCKKIIGSTRQQKPIIMPYTHNSPCKKRYQIPLINSI